MWMDKFLKGVSLFVLIVAVFACQDTTVAPPEKPPFLISDIRIADYWAANSSTPELVEARVEHPDGIKAIQMVRVQVVAADNTVEGSAQLYDDGGATTMSGDLIAADGVFRNLLVPDALVSRSGVYTFRFSATDQNGNTAPVVEKTIQMGENHPPQLHKVFAPDLLPSGFYADTLAAIVFDPDSVGDVNDIVLDISKVGMLPVRYTKKSWERSDIDSIFVLGIDSSFAAGLKGAYLLSFKARDQFGAESDTLLRKIQIENKAGKLSEITMPHQITKPASGTKQIFISVKANDPQGLTDVDSVYFYSRKPDGSLSNNGKPFVMVDNGKAFNIANPFDEAGDKTAGDGIYSLTSIIDTGAATGTFVFSFYSRDLVGNLSAMGQDSIEVKP